MACTRDRLDVDVTDINPELEIDRFELKFYETSMQEIGQSFDQWIEDYPLLMSSVDSLAQLEVMRTDSFFLGLYEEQKAHGDLREAFGDIEDGFRYLRYYYPDLSSTRLITYFSGVDFQYPVLLVDSHIFVSSDLFLGPDCPFYSAFPAYIRYQFQPSLLPSQLFEEIGAHMMQQDYNDASLLNYMIGEGKKYYFVESMLYGMPDSLIIRYPSQKWQWCVDNEQNMWSYFLEEDLLFQTDPRNKDRFINPAPFSKFYKPIDQDSPGRVGAWIGWQIVRAYMNAHPEIGLNKLMQDTDHQRIFKESTYKPL
jgi:hypothetical protein